MPYPCCCENCDNAPDANFSYQQISQNPNCFRFFDESIPGSYGPIVRWEWSFGDGATSTEQNPTHCYAGNGPWQVVLKVFDARNCLGANADVFSGVSPSTCVLCCCWAAPPNSIEIEYEALICPTICGGINLSGGTDLLILCPGTQWSYRSFNEHICPGTGTNPLKYYWNVNICRFGFTLSVQYSQQRDGCGGQNSRWSGNIALPSPGKFCAGPQSFIVPRAGATGGLCTSSPASVNVRWD